MYRIKVLFCFVVFGFPILAISSDYPIDLPRLDELIVDEELIVDNPETEMRLKAAIADKDTKVISRMAQEVKLADFYKHLIIFMKDEDKESLANVLRYEKRIKNLGVILGDYYLTKAEEGNILAYYQKAYDFYQKDNSESHRPIYNNALMLYAGKVRSKKGTNYLELFKEAIKLGSYNALKYTIDNDLIYFEDAIKIMSSRNELVNLLSLGKVYYDGVGTDIDHKKSLKYFNKAYAQYQSRTAAFASAQIYYDELREISLAKQYYKYASELGHCEAKNALGVIFLEEKSNDKALLQFKKGYECGSLDAGFNSALMNLEAENIDEGMRNLKYIADKGYAKASYNLGLYYAIGKYVEKDLVLAEKYLGMAKKQGHQDADKFLRKLKQE